MAYSGGKYNYELVKDWAKLPESESILDVRSLSVDSQDRVYVMNASRHPIMILDITPRV